MEYSMIDFSKNMLPILGELIQDGVSTCITDREKNSILSTANDTNEKKDDAVYYEI